LYIWDIKTTNKDGVRDLLKASECSDYSSPHGNHWLEGTGNVGTSEIYTQYVKQLISKHTNQAQYHQNHEDLESRDEDPLLGDQCTDEEDWETQTVSVEAEDERVGVVLSGKDLHYHWIQAEAYLHGDGSSKYQPFWWDSCSPGHAATDRSVHHCCLLNKPRPLSHAHP
jgi:hypothetical protein